jgi:hypothetical protein
MPHLHYQSFYDWSNSDAWNKMFNKMFQELSPNFWTPCWDQHNIVYYPPDSRKTKFLPAQTTMNPMVPNTQQVGGASKKNKRKCFCGH